MVAGKYLRTSINTKLAYLRCRRLLRWAEEDAKLFVSLRSVCQSSSLAPSVEKKRLELKFSEKKAAPWRAAAAVAFKKNSRLSLLKVKLTFTACSLTKFMALPEGHP
jgi:hypothetical protein